MHCSDYGNTRLNYICVRNIANGFLKIALQAAGWVAINVSNLTKSTLFFPMPKIFLLGFFKLTHTNIYRL